MAPCGISLVPRPGLVHHAISSPSVSAMDWPGFDGALGLQLMEKPDNEKKAPSTISKSHPHD